MVVYHVYLRTVNTKNAIRINEIFKFDSSHRCVAVLTKIWFSQKHNNTFNYVKFATTSKFLFIRQILHK